MEQLPLFEYSIDDFIHTTESWNGHPPRLSKFDKRLLTQWEQAMEDGLFRYSLGEMRTQVLKGDKHYVAVLNEKRVSMKRRSQFITSVGQQFNPELFNFNKITKEEILFVLRGHEDSREKKGQNLVLLNVSPTARGNVLIVPNVEKCLPQVVTQEAILLVLHTMLLSSHRGFRMGFNSLCAFSSVNHLHFHAYYLDEELYVEYCEVNDFADICYELTCMPVRGFAFQLHGNTIAKIARLVHSITSYFTKEDIAHSIYVTRGTRFGEGRHSRERTVRLYIWPRKSVYGTMSEELFNVGSVELAGHLLVKETNGFAEMTQGYADKVLKDAELMDDRFQIIRKSVKAMVENSSWLS